RLALEEALVERAAERYGPSLRRLRPLLRSALGRRAWAEAAFVLWAIGGAERFRGRLRSSEAAYLRSRELARRAGDRFGQGYAFLGLGGVTRIMGKLEDSARWYARAGRLFRRTDDLFARAYAGCGAANALRQLGRLREAETLYRESRALYSRLGDEVDGAYVDWGLGEVHLRRGELNRASRRFRHALRRFRICGETRGEVLAMLSAARALHARGSTASAETLFQKGYGLARRKGIHTHLETFT
ncbi:MAG: tetratricopeptide repeat protein, partial [Elusimicrobiota bacterium]